MVLISWCPSRFQRCVTGLAADLDLTCYRAQHVAAVRRPRRCSWKDKSIYSKKVSSIKAHPKIRTSRIYLQAGRGGREPSKQASAVYEVLPEAGILFPTIGYYQPSFAQAYAVATIVADMPPVIGIVSFLWKDNNGAVSVITCQQHRQSCRHLVRWGRGTIRRRTRRHIRRRRRRRKCQCLSSRCSCWKHRPQLPSQSTRWRRPMPRRSKSASRWQRPCRSGRWPSAGTWPGTSGRSG